MIPDWLCLLAAYGLCFGLQNRKADVLHGWLRRWPFFEAMLKCSYCTGFHCGWIVWLLVRAPYCMSAVEALTEAVAYAFASAVGCYLLDTVAARLER